MIFLQPPTSLISHFCVLLKRTQWLPSAHQMTLCSNPRFWRRALAWSPPFACFSSIHFIHAFIFPLIQSLTQQKCFNPLLYTKCLEK